MDHNVIILLQFLFCRQNSFLDCVKNVSIIYFFLNFINNSVHDCVSMVETCEWDNVDIGTEPPDDNRFESAKDSGDEDFGSKHLSVTFYC